MLLINTADIRQDGAKYYDDLKMTGTLVFNDGSKDVGPYRILNFPTHIMVDRSGIVQRVLQQSLDPETARHELQRIRLVARIRRRRIAREASTWYDLARWACSSAVEQWTFNPLVVGSNPTGLTSNSL